MFGRGFLSQRHEHDFEAFVDGGFEAVFAGLDCAFHGAEGVSLACVGIRSSMDVDLRCHEKINLVMIGKVFA